MSLFEQEQQEQVSARDIARRFNGICAVTLKYTQGVRTHQYSQLGLMVMAHGIDFIIQDFTEWCLSPDAAKAEHPFHTYFSGFDNRMRGITNPEPEPAPRTEKTDALELQHRAEDFITEFLQDGAKYGNQVREAAREMHELGPTIVGFAASELVARGAMTRRNCNGKWIWALAPVMTFETISQEAQS